MAIEEKVIQPESVTNAEQPVADTPSPVPPVNDLAKQLQEANERAAKAEALADQQRKAAEEAEQKFKNAKSKIGQYYDDRNKALEDQGMYKPLWEEANKTNQEMQNEENNLKQQKHVGEFHGQLTSPLCSKEEYWAKIWTSTSPRIHISEIRLDRDI